MKKTFLTALVGASALALSACGGGTGEGVEQSGDDMGAEPAEIVEEPVDDVVVEPTDEPTEPATNEADDPEDGMNNPIPPRRAQSRSR